MRQSKAASTNTSHVMSCVRLNTENAPWLLDNGHLGTDSRSDRHGCFRASLLVWIRWGHPASKSQRSSCCSLCFLSILSASWLVGKRCRTQGLHTERPLHLRGMDSRRRHENDEVQHAALASSPSRAQANKTLWVTFWYPVQRFPGGVVKFCVFLTE